MPSMLLHGDSDIGKTMIVQKFVRDHPNQCNAFGEVQARKVPCMMIDRGRKLAARIALRSPSE
jgi:hypothetical protein